MTKIITILSAIAYLAICAASNVHAGDVCGGTRNPELCRLVIMAGDAYAVARDAGNGGL